MRAVILHGIMSVPNGPPQSHFGPIPNHHLQTAIHAPNGRGINLMGNGRGGGGRLIVAGAVVSQWDNNRGGSAQQRLSKARNNKEKKPQSAKSQPRRQSQKVTRYALTADFISDFYLKLKNSCNICNFQNAFLKVVCIVL